ncbi:acetyl/propionyl/methylcrotonyl-CoA carboxylase subunit alpha [Ramlibacter humi]|uniref:Acetyl-CoA carboxylase biotin carboxylase subunit n=1 Tax=Ramlibacter humi TaxID=2530451 RepID=A0A4Z0C855_9BURK|nr:acetyl-CoA carboxylase biotin carboxylase subunit [Ramlibacter humi]TFZ07866.1 acetyl-CoA carboxylase biotin carboxylase subunit [Ramlibacter humi]
MNPTPFRKLLVANRGEIALRVLRTAHRMGYATVAVHSTADAHAPHVNAADEAVCIGGPLPAESYLRIDAIVDAARRTGADAVHPGYGFLAENAAFAQACRDAGLVFVGPSPEAIRAMGDKAGAKQRMAAAGVPCIPGHQGDDPSEERLAEEARRIGFPVMVKATAGGGGRGMRLVRDASEFLPLLRSAQSEARNAFGDGTVLLERAIESPRHVEIQVFADRHGNAVHLGERDCSVQRRHQKLVEESPSPAVDAALRRRMGAAAVAAVRAIGYEGAGTLEFLLDAQGQFWFMEMNTRLQVEHPVTEALTGLDLVEWQLRVAAGEPLPLRQQDIRFEGHAIEVRLCAEDAAQGFLPQAGTLRRWRPPEGLRVEHALHDGAVVPPFYDSMIAKLVAHGGTREEARRRLSQGLRQLLALGVTTNQAFLASVLAHPEFAAGRATTAFIAAHGGQLLEAAGAEVARSQAIAAWLLLASAPSRRRADGALAPRLPIPVWLQVDGAAVHAKVLALGQGNVEVRIGEAVHRLQDTHAANGSARATLDGTAHAIEFAREGDALWLQVAGRPHRVEDLTWLPAPKPGAGNGDGRVRAAMNGRVAAVLVGPGETVTAGQPLLTLEAMKMEHVHAAPAAGRVTALHAAAGQQVAGGAVLIEIAAG